MTAPTVLIMAGGTGGHIFPALATADYLRERGYQIVWLGTRAGMESRLVPARGYAIEWLDIGGVRGKGVLKWLALPMVLNVACWQAWRTIRRIRPSVVLGMGGFAAFPGGLMAVLAGRPLVIHEQNAVAGLTNRVLSHIADRVLCAFPGVFRDKGGRSCVVGNPVRRDISSLDEPGGRYAARQGPLRLLVVGGSLGAQALNDTVPRALAEMPAALRPLVRHQSGEKHIAALTEKYRQAGVEAECLAFIDDMAAAYAWADLVVCRSGALTVSEIAAAGVASVLVPFPHAVDDHQTGNARYLSEAGAAVLLPQAELNPARLAQLLSEAQRSQLAAMAQKARALARPGATDDVATACIELAA